MRFVLPAEGVSSALVDAVRAFETEANEGNYEVDDFLDWTALDEQVLLGQCLRANGIDFPLPECDENSKPAGLAPVLHVISLAHLKNEPHQLDERLLKHLSAADMPGPFLIYVDRLLQESPAGSPWLVSLFSEDLERSNVSQVYGRLRDHACRLLAGVVLSLTEKSTPTAKRPNFAEPSFDDSAGDGRYDRLCWFLTKRHLRYFTQRPCPRLSELCFDRLKTPVDRAWDPNNEIEVDREGG